MISFSNNFFFSNRGFDFKNNKSFQNNLKKAIRNSYNLHKEFLSGNNEILQSFTSSYQKKIRDIKKTIYHKEKKRAVIGLGGSSSGAKALSFFQKDEIVYFDNLDYEYFNIFFKNNNIKEYTFFIISKSGDTFETLALLNLLISESKKKNINIYDSIIIITENKENILHSFARKNKIKFIEHNPEIGGRFSILSETGMLPFVESDIKVEEASEKFIDLLKNEDHELSPAQNVAIILTCLQDYNLSINCNLIYNYRLKHFSYWFHQLHAESLGKNGNGMTPITSICPKDHHSMMQLYLDGPKNKFFNIFSPQDEVYYKKFENLNFYNIEEKSPNELIQKQFHSVIETFFEKKIPHRIINITDHKNPLNLIELFSYFILETILLGNTIGINPYDQPSVQLIKEKIFKY